MNFADFHFLRPWWLLAVVPALMMLLWLARSKYSRGDWATVCDAELLPHILQETPVQTGYGSLIAGGLASLLVILALAGPTWQRLPSPAYRNDSALVIALDLSKSMDASDIKPSRLSRARYKIADILKQRKDGQTALLVYGGDAFTVTPLTTDIATINSQLEALTTDIMPSPGSNAVSAIEQAANLLRQAGLASGHILLVTDGVDADSAAKASDLLGDYRLSVLALGSEEGAPVPMPGSGFMKDSAGNIAIAKLDIGLLSGLANAGHGLFQTVSADDDDVNRLAALFNKVAGDNQTEQSNLLLQQWDEKGPWLLLLVLPWAALRFRKGLLTLSVICLLPFTPRDALAFDWQSLWQNPDQRAKQAFDQQQFEQAAQQFDNPAWRAAAQYKAGQYQQAAETLKNDQSAEGHYNRGNALAKAGQLQEALQAYGQALALDPNHADAKYNKALVEKQLQDQQRKTKTKTKTRIKKSSDQQSKDQQSSEQKDQSAENNNSKSQDGENSDQANDSDKSGQAQQKPESQPKQQQSSPEEKSTDESDQAQAKQESEQKPTDSSQAAAEEKKADSEVERANQQLLKRIPDEPTGLLKRKFKYQYGQRGRSAPTGPAW